MNVRQSRRGGNTVDDNTETVAEPNPKRLPWRHTGGDAPLHSLPPLRTANRGVACCANALVEMTSIPAVIATTHANLCNIVMICLPADFGHTGLSNTTERRSLQLNLRPFPIYKHLHHIIHFP
jgi:hypothetical protein